jgi:hypothetical protein
VQILLAWTPALTPWHLRCAHLLPSVQWSPTSPVRQACLWYNIARLHHTLDLLWSGNRFFIATHPEVEAKVCAELNAHGLLASSKTPAPRAVAFEDLAELTYLGACIKVLYSMSSMVCTASHWVCQQICINQQLLDIIAASSTTQQLALHGCRRAFV